METEKPKRKGGNRNRWKNHKRKGPAVTVRIDGDVYEWLLIEADNRDTPLREYINSLLRQAYDESKPPSEIKESAK